MLRFHRLILTLGVLALLLPAVSAAGQARDGDDRMRAEMLGALTATRLAVDVRAAPVRDVIGALSRAIDVPIVGRYDDDRTGHGVNPRVPIVLELRNASALDVLELVLEQATLYEEATWQLRKGFVEVGTKHRLGAPAAVERRLYPIRDLMHEAPRFTSTGRDADLSGYYDSPYRVASLSRPVQGGLRKHPAEAAREILEMIVEVVEPGNWDYGQFKTRDVGEPETPVRPEAGDGTRRYVRSSLKIGRIRVYEDQLIVNAPDFMHREIDGYPTPVPPPLLDDETARQRSAQATSEKIAITVLGIERARPRRWSVLR